MSEVRYYENSPAGYSDYVNRNPSGLSRAAFFLAKRLARPLAAGIAGRAARKFLNSRSSRDELISSSRTMPTHNLRGAFDAEAGMEVQDGDSAGVQATKESDAAGGRRFIGPVTPRRDPIGTGTMNSHTDAFGAHTLVCSGDRAFAGMKLKIHKNIPSIPDAVPNFLDTLCGSGSVVTQFAGIMQSSIDVRAFCMDVFRHNLSGNQLLPSSSTNSPYPATGYLINSPQQVPIDIPMANGYTGIATSTSSKQPFCVRGNSNLITGATQVPGTAYPVGAVGWSCINRPDLEDMSWNLNKLKVNTKTSIANSHWSHPAEKYVTGDHNRVSRVWVNNSQKAAPTSTTPTSAPYKYSSVFNSGHITYNFMNKGDGGLIGEVIVFRKKKTQTASNFAADYIEHYPIGGNFTSSAFLDGFIAPIANGYLNTIQDKIGTENLEGRQPLLTDCFNSPYFPFLPKLRKTVEGQNPYAEVERIKFALPSGGRRELRVELGGARYDPSTVAVQVGDTIGAVPIVDDHTYFVMISCHGSKASRATGGAMDMTNQKVLPQGKLGDCYTQSMLQWTATYVENISACVYPKGGRSRLYVNGAGAQINDSDPGGPDWYGSVNIPQEQAVRTPSTVSWTRIYDPVSGAPLTNTQQTGNGYDTRTGA